MTALNKPKRALLAYCALADRLHQPKTNLIAALTPFFMPVCRDMAGQMFDAAKFSEEVGARYGLRIPRLAALGLAEQLARDGLLQSIAGKASKPVYQYSTTIPIEPDDSPAVTELEIDRVLIEFVSVCRNDPVLASDDQQALQEGFLDRLLNTDSMRLLSRKDGSTVAKKTASTLTIKAPTVDSHDQRELRLDFHVAQFLLDLKDLRPELFNRVSDIAFANMAAETLACFSESTDTIGRLENFVVYMDSPLLLDVLGVNADYSEYGAELLQMIEESGATAAVLDDCIVEAESVISAQNASQRSGISQRSSQWGTSARPHILMALMSNVADRAAAKGIALHRDPELDLLRRSKSAVGDVQAEMSKRMSAWPTPDARHHDEKSIWSMFRIRDSSNLCTKIRDSKAIFVARNTALVRIANDTWRIWLQNGARHSQHTAERWAPIAMSDKQLAGYLWLRRGTGNGQMSRVRLLAHCSAAIRPRPDVKTRAYNLVLELHGKEEADHIAALLEDREGERALMRATRADPEDVTRERLPYIIEQVKLAAGEFAAVAVREEERMKLESVKLAHDAEITRRSEEADTEREKNKRRATEVDTALAQEKLEREILKAQIASMKQQNAEAEQVRQWDEIEKLGKAFHAGQTSYSRLRWELVLLFSALSLLASTSAPNWEPWWQMLAALCLSGFGFWFVPEFLEGIVHWYGKKQLRLVVERMGIGSALPTNDPDFKARKWPALEELKTQLAITSEKAAQDGWRPSN